MEGSGHDPLLHLRNACNNLLGKSIRIWKDNIKMDSVRERVSVRI